jgi:hypothetical protein
MPEQWKPIEGYPGYEVSDQGNVKLKRGTITPGSLERNGYLRVTLCADGKLRHFGVHRLVAQAFIPNPENKPEVNHLAATTDNRACVLEWVTERENVKHANENITKRRVVGVDRIDILTGEIIKYAKVCDVAEDGFCPKAVSGCIRGLTQSHKQFYWKYSEPTVHKEIEGERWVRLKDSIYPEVAKFDRYEVSDHGRVRNQTGRMRTINKSAVSLFTGVKGEEADIYVYRLVLMAFNVPNPDGKGQVDHINSNPTDHRLVNLRWATPKENMNNDATKKKIAAATRRDTQWIRVTFKDQHQEVIKGITEASSRTGVYAGTIKKYIDDPVEMGFFKHWRFEQCDAP